MRRCSILNAQPEQPPRAAAQSSSTRIMSTASELKTPYSSGFQTERLRDSHRIKQRLFPSQNYAGESPSH
eukprot:3936133-Rhodomonas_salina.1